MLVLGSIRFSLGNRSTVNRPHVTWEIFYIPSLHVFRGTGLAAIMNNDAVLVEDEYEYEYDENETEVGAV